MISIENGYSHGKVNEKKQIIGLNGNYFLF